MIKRLLPVLLAVGMLLCLTAARAEGEQLTLGIFTTTDMHGKCYDVNPVTGKPVADSYLKVPAAMAEQKALVDETLLLDCGDVIQGTPIISYNTTMEGGAANPMALCLRWCGYNNVTLGNHEFSFSPEVQQRYFDLLGDRSGSFPGTPVQLVCANFIDTATQQPRLTPYSVYTYTVGGRTFRVGVIGFENVSVPSWEPAAHYEGADFVHAENTGRTFAFEWDHYWKKALKEDEGCDFVIVLAHAGEGSADPAAPFKASEQNYDLIRSTTGIDLVVSGHNHVPGVSVCPNAEGREIPVVNGGTSMLTRTVVTFGADGSITVGGSDCLPLRDYPNDEGLKALMTPYYERTVPFVEQQIGTLSGAWDDVTDLFCVQSDTMNLVHEAQLWACGAELSLAAPVTVKDFCVGQLLRGEASAPISLKDCYSLYCYDSNILFMIEISGQQLKDWLERCCNDFTVGADGTVTGGGYGTDQLYGIGYEIYLGNEPGSRVVNMTYQGEPLDMERTFRLAINSYRLSANASGDSFGWYATTGITVGDPEVLWDGSVSPAFGSIGGSVTLIIADYIKAMTAQGRDITPPEAPARWVIHPGAQN